MGAVAVVAGLTISAAQAADYHAEVIEWALEPCMMVRAALDAQDLDEETLNMGITLEHIVHVMVAEKDAAVRDLVKNMDPDLPWKKASRRLCSDVADLLKADARSEMSGKQLIACSAFAALCGVAGLAAADVPAKCAASLQAVEDLAGKTDAKLLEVEITLKHGYGRAKTLSNANTLIVRLGEFVIATGHIASAYSTFIGCVAERDQ